MTANRVTASRMTANRYVIRRQWWTAAVAPSGDGWVFAVEPGCRRVVIRRSDLLPLVDYWRHHDELVAEPGDRFVCCGAAIDDTLVAEVVGRGASGALTVRLSQPLPPGCDRVQLTELSADLGANARRPS